MNKRNKKKMMKTAAKLGIRISWGRFSDGKLVHIPCIEFDPKILTKKNVGVVLRAIRSERLRAIEIRSLSRQ